MLPKREPLQNKRHTKTENEGLETNIPSKWTGKRVRVTIHIPDKIDFKRRAVQRDPEGQSYHSREESIKKT